MIVSVSRDATVDTEATDKSSAHNEGKTFSFQVIPRLVVFVETSQTLSSVLFFTAFFFTAIAYEQTRIVAINENLTRFSYLQVERAGSKMLCAIGCIFNLLCAFNFLQPTKKFVFSVASRATGRLQIKPSGSGDKYVVP